MTQQLLRHFVRATLLENLSGNGSPTVVHIAGPSGAGKTTLLSKIVRIYPRVVTKDLDEIDEQATAELSLSEDKSKWTDSEFEKHHKRKQAILDKFLSTHQNSIIVLAGFHTEFGHTLSFPASLRLMLNTSSSEAARRGWIRNRREEPTRDELADSIAQNNRDIEELTGLGYKPMSPDDIVRSIDKLQGRAS